MQILQAYEPWSVIGIKVSVSALSLILIVPFCVPKHIYEKSLPENTSIILRLPESKSMLDLRSIVTLPLFIKITEASMFELSRIVSFIGISWQFANGVNSKLMFFSVKFQTNTGFNGTNPDGWQTFPSPKTSVWGQNRSVMSSSYKE